MQKLKLQYKPLSKKTLIQKCRSCDAAIYEVFNSGRSVGWEVFRIRRRPKEHIFGRTYESRESYPTDGDFGTTAKFCRNLLVAEFWFAWFSAHPSAACTEARRAYSIKFIPRGVIKEVE